MTQRPPEKQQPGKQPSEKQPSRKSPEDAPPARRNWAAAVGGDAGIAATAAFARAGFTDPALVLHWREIAGAEVARIARPVRFSPKDGTLTLLAEPGAALFLGHESRALMQRINSWAGRPLVAKVKFVQGRLTQAHPLPPLPRPLAAPVSSDPSNAYQGPGRVKAALQSLARWRQASSHRNGRGSD